MTKTPSGGSSIPCTCAEQAVIHGDPSLMHTHQYSQTGSGTCAFPGCACDWSLGAMMIAPDDPLRDTPEKAEQYSRTIQRLKAELEERAAALNPSKGIAIPSSRASDADKAAALRLLSDGVVTPALLAHIPAATDPDAGVPPEIKRLREAQAASRVPDFAARSRA